MECSAVNDAGLPCQKPMYHARNGEHWDHAGGHVYATSRTMEALATMHYDAGALLAGEKVTMHTAEECTGEGFCAWR